MCKKKSLLKNRKSPCGEVANVLDGNIVEREFKFQSRYYIDFWTNALRKSMNSLIPPPQLYVK